MIQYKKYIQADSLEEAYTLYQEKQNTLIGGMLWLNMADRRYAGIIDLCRLNLAGIKKSNDEFRIGAYTSLLELEKDTELNKTFSYSFRDALCDIEGVQLRGMATAGGTVALRAGFSDLCTLLLALNADVELYKAGRMSLQSYITRDRKERDILTYIYVPEKASSAAYASARNSKTDLPTLNCAAARFGDSLRIAVGARPAIASLTVVSPEDLSAEAIQTTAQNIAGSTVFGSNLRASAEYRKMIAETLVKRTLEKIATEER